MIVYGEFTHTKTVTVCVCVEMRSRLLMKFGGFRECSVNVGGDDDDGNELIMMVQHFGFLFSVEKCN